MPARCNTNTVGFNLAWKDIAHLAEERRADLIVMGTTGAGGDATGLLGAIRRRSSGWPPRPCSPALGSPEADRQCRAAGGHPCPRCGGPERLLPLVAGFGRSSICST